MGRSLRGGNGNPLQYSCLENPRDRGPWRTTVQGVAKSQTRLSTEHAGTHACTQEGPRAGKVASACSGPVNLPTTPIPGSWELLGESPPTLFCIVGVTKTQALGVGGEGASPSQKPPRKAFCRLQTFSPLIGTVSSVQFDSLQPHGLQHAKPPCPSPTPGVYSNSCPLSW